MIKYIYYASPSFGEAYSDRQLATKFELWVEFFCVPTCFHVRIPKPCLSVCPYPEKTNHPDFVNISPTVVINTSMERSLRVLHHGNPKIRFSLEKIATIFGEFGHYWGSMVSLFEKRKEETKHKMSVVFKVNKNRRFLTNIYIYIYIYIYINHTVPIKMLEIWAGRVIDSLASWLTWNNREMCSWISS